jgi:hypothetical protein
MAGRADPKDFLVSDFMVRNPIQAELWQPVSFARQLLLINSFSYLPILMEESGRKVVHLISDYSLTQRKVFQNWLPLTPACEPMTSSQSAMVECGQNGWRDSSPTCDAWAGVAAHRSLLQPDGRLDVEVQ